MVDAKHGGLRKYRVNCLVQFVRRRAIPSEWLLHDDPRPIRATATPQRRYDAVEQARWDRQVMRRVARRRKLAPEARERVLVPIVAVYIFQQAGQFREGVRI